MMYNEYKLSRKIILFLVIFISETMKGGNRESSPVWRGPRTLQVKPQVTGSSVKGLLNRFQSFQEKWGYMCGTSRDTGLRISSQTRGIL